MGVGEIALIEHVREDADDVVLVLRVVAVGASVQGVAAPVDLCVREAGLIGIDQLLTGQCESGDPGQLLAGASIANEPVAKSAPPCARWLWAARSGTTCRRAWSGWPGPDGDL